MVLSCFSRCRRERRLPSPMSYHHAHPASSTVGTIATTTTTTSTASSSAGSLATTSARIGDQYEYMELLGEGKTARVFRVRAKTTPRFEGAAKVIRKEYLHTAQRKRALRDECAILQRLRHPCILALFDVFEDDTQVVVVTERAHGGELLTAMTRPTTTESDGDGHGDGHGDGYPWHERALAALMRELLTAVAYLHANGITHHDIKLENLLCRSHLPRDGLILVDFGLAQRAGVGVHDLTGLNGTCHYMAPEMFGRDSRYGCEIDLWAVGVVLFALLFGRLPFDAKFMSQVEDLIVANALVYPPDLVHEVSSNALACLRALLTTDPSQRITAQQALRLPWLQPGGAPSRRWSEHHIAQVQALAQKQSHGQGGGQGSGHGGGEKAVMTQSTKSVAVL